MKHPDHVVGWDGSIDDLAAAVGQMRYDHVAAFIGALADDLQRQGHHDHRAGRHLLAIRLAAAAGHLIAAERDVARAWNLSEPH